MKITFAMLEDHLSEYSILRLYKDECPFIYNALLLKTGEGEFEPHILYVTMAEQLQSVDLGVNALPDNLACIGYLDFRTASACEASCNLLQIGTDLPVERVFAEILCVIGRFHSWSDRLLHSLCLDKNYYTFLEIAHEMVKNPLWIVDKSQCLMAYTEQDQSDSVVWQETVQTGYLSLYGTTVSEMAGIEARIMDSSVPVMIKISAIKEPFLSTNILLGSESVAKLNLLACHHPITAGHIDICQMLASMLQFGFMQKQVSEVEKKYTYMKLLRDLLGQAGLNAYSLENYLKEIGWKPKKYFTLVVVPCQSIVKDERELENLRYQIASILSGSICIDYEMNLVCLINSGHTEPLTGIRLKNLGTFLEKYRLHAGVSKVYEKLLDTNQEFILARQAVAIAVMDYGSGRIHRYQDYAMLHIRNILAEHGDLKQFCFDGFLKLWDYDRENNTQFVNTLYVYLANNQHPVKTAEALFIHRSTLNYRLKKIEGIAGINLDNSEDLFVMNLSYRLLNYNDYLRERSDS